MRDERPRVRRVIQVHVPEPSDDVMQVYILIKETFGSFRGCPSAHIDSLRDCPNGHVSDAETTRGSVSTDSFVNDIVTGDCVS